MLERDETVTVSPRPVKRHKRVRRTLDGYSRSLSMSIGCVLLVTFGILSRQQSYTHRLPTLLQTTTDNTHDSSALTFDRTGTPAHNVRDLDEHDTVLLITHLVPQHGQPLVYLCSAPTHIAPCFARCVAPTPLARWGAPSTAPQICS